MNFSSVEIIALIFVIGVLIKFAVLILSRDTYLKFIKKIYSKPEILVLVQFILAMIVIYYLAQELSSVQIIGGVVLGALLTGMSLSVYSKELMPAIIKILKQGLKNVWLPLIIWIILILWVLRELFSLF